MGLTQYIETMGAEWTWIFRIVIACLCGGAIGIERTLRQKDAGFRTHLIVALGAALVMIISKYGFDDCAKVDAARVASNIIPGISFLGGGMIFIKGLNIKGLTTAAGVWSTAAVGMAIGAGLYLTGIVSTLLIVIIQCVFHTFLIGFDKVLANDVTFDVVVRLKNTPDALSHFKEILSEHRVQTTDIKVTLGDDGYFTLVLSVRETHTITPDALLNLFNAEANIQSIMM